MLVEGQSEETFVKRTLGPWLANHGVFVRPVILWTKRLAAGGGHQGGVGSWQQIRNNLIPLLDNGDAWVTTLLDFYGLPDDMPGRTESLTLGAGNQKATRLQQDLTAALGHFPRFIPFLALHEFEAWLFAEPAIVATHFDNAAAAKKLAAEVPDPGGPEAINHGRDTHPKARLRKHFPGYKETSDGPTVLREIGIPAIRARCPHFAGWLAQLEALGVLA